MTNITQKGTERTKKLGAPFPEKIRAQFLGVCTHVHMCMHTHIHLAVCRRPLWAVPSGTTSAEAQASRLHVSKTTCAQGTDSRRSEDFKVTSGKRIDTLLFVNGISHS